MTASLTIRSLAQSIAGLSVAGVSLKDLDEIQDQFGARDCPVLLPNPDGFISGFNAGRAAWDKSKVDVTYTLNYRYLHAPVTALRVDLEAYAGMVQNIEAVLEVFLNSDTLSGIVDLQPGGVIHFGTVKDPAGNAFFGCDLPLKILSHFDT